MSAEHFFINIHVSKLTVDELDIDVVNIASGTLSIAGSISARDVIYGGGKVLNVVQTVRKTRLAITTTTANLIFADGSLSASLTPSSTSNKILVTFAFYATHADSESSQFWLLRSDSTHNFANGTVVVQGDASGSATRVTGGVGESNYTGAGVTEPASLVHFEYLDSPSSASEVSYGIRGRASNGTMYVGGTANTSDADALLFPSSITLKEIAG